MKLEIRIPIGKDKFLIWNKGLWVGEGTPNEDLWNKGYQFRARKIFKIWFVEVKKVEQNGIKIN